jgi:long-chain acyl-CoA synthetase
MSCSGSEECTLKKTPETLVDILAESAARFADKPLFGVRDEGGQWSWLPYDLFHGSRVSGYANGLAGHGIGHGDTVAFIGSNSVDWAAAAHGAFRLGAVFVPMYETQTDEEWRHIIADSEAKILIVANEKILGRVERFMYDIPTLKRAFCLTLIPEREMSIANLTWCRPAASMPTQPSAGDIACIIYTSGTTGMPKGVVLTHGNIVSNVLASRARFDITHEDRCLSHLPWAHAFGQTAELHTFISLGASIAICENPKRDLKAFLPEVKPTILCSVPRIFNQIYLGTRKTIEEQSPVKRWLARTFPKRFVYPKLRQERLGGRLRFVVSGGAALEYEVSRFLEDAGITVYQGYGLSETSPVIACEDRHTKQFGTPGTVGTPIAGVSVRLDFSAAPDEPGVGEIQVSGPNVMVGYWKRPKETLEAFTADGWFRTGDLGNWTDEDLLVVCGRAGEVFKLSNGNKVAPSPIEEKIKLSPLIANVMIYGLNKPHCVALVVPTNPETTKEILVREIGRLTEDCKPYERPSRIAIIPEDFTQDNGMLTPTLKLKRRKVLERWGKVIEQLYQ